MSWYERAKGRRKFRVNEEDEELVQVIWFHDGDIGSDYDYSSESKEP